MLYQTRDNLKIAHLDSRDNLDLRRLNKSGVYVFYDGKRRKKETSFSELGLCLISVYNLMVSADRNYADFRR